eukprot:TRINITY_DN22571_c0_g1_i1.p1 TRINITY_DN22571_c0_g1~~TRINITY_DN22571_c0_g1_i1.p1  ORF type:complete len:620 (+),score=25.78 TRINITY_DN22571_c0_g1_i1:169-2028(+)
MMVDTSDIECDWSALSHGTVSSVPAAVSEGFTCGVCGKYRELGTLYVLDACSCVLCRSCLTAFAVDEIASTLNKFRASKSVDPLPYRSALHFSCLPCPACHICNGLDRPDLLELCGDSIRQAEEVVADDALSLVPRCPSCGIAVEAVTARDDELPLGLRPTGVPEFDKTVPKMMSQSDSDGNMLSREALIHRERHRFRCKCGTDFCNMCRASPYHLGYSCEEWQAKQNRVKCHFCDEGATSVNDIIAEAKRLQGTQGEQLACSASTHDAEAFELMVKTLPLKVLRAQMLSLKFSAVKLCKEREELETLAKKVHVCSSVACRQRLADSCLKQLPCEHLCAAHACDGVCPPCLACPLLPSSPPSCSSSSEARYCAYCADDLLPGPAVWLSCKHVAHSSCLKKKLELAFDRRSRQPLSYDFRSCPQCRNKIEECPSWPKDLTLLLKNVIELEVTLGNLARKRLKLDPDHRFDDAIRPGGLFDGRPKDYAITLYQYFLCEECERPYYGGERRCGGQAAGGQSSDSRHICGGCAAFKAGATCAKGHDPTYMEWKCYYCCSVACWFCWGTTHMCDSCHTAIQIGGCRPKACLGRGKCALQVAHTPNGTGDPFCLGCSLCRHSDGL